MRETKGELDMLVSPRTFAKLKGVPRTQVKQWLARGLPHRKDGDNILIDTNEAEKWLNPAKGTAIAIAAGAKPFLLNLWRAVKDKLSAIRLPKLPKLNRELASARLHRGFSLAIVPHDAAGRMVQFVFNRRTLKIVIILAILLGFAFFFLLGLAAAVPSLNNTIEQQDAIIQVYEQENEDLRAEVDDLLKQLEERDRLVEAMSSHQEIDPKVTLAGTRAENPNVPVPSETQRLAEYVGLFRTLLEEKLDEVTEAEQRVAEYQAEAEATPNIWPTDSRKITSGFGVRPAVFGAYISRGVLITHTFHQGIDIGADPGEPVYATAAGTVTFADYDGAWGNKVIIEHNDSYTTLYAHLSCMHVQEGDTVRRGQLIGEVGATGKTTGSHLHYGIRLRGVSVNPARYVR